MTIDATNEDFLDPDPDLEDDPIDTTNLVDESALDEADSEDDEMARIIDALNLDTKWADIPKSVRESTGIDYAAQPWETILDNNRKYPGKSLQLWAFTHPTAKATAKARAKSIRTRLFTAVPEELWRVGRSKPASGNLGVYVES